MKKILSILSFIFINNNSFADDMNKLGFEIFNNKAQCSACHALQSARSDGNIGPNLDMLKPQILQIINAVTNGIGVVPSWDGILTPEEIEAVAYYVFKSTNK